jgi:hypothetical protein
MPERLFWTAIPTSWRKAFLGNSVTFDSSDNYLLWNPNMILCSIYKNQSRLNPLDTLLPFVENSHRACWCISYALTSYSGGAWFDSRP